MESFSLQCFKWSQRDVCGCVGVVSDGGKRRREREAVESGMTFTFIKSNIRTKGPKLRPWSPHIELISIKMYLQFHSSCIRL